MVDELKPKSCRSAGVGREGGRGLAFNECSARYGFLNSDDSSNSLLFRRYETLVLSTLGLELA